MCGEKDLFQDDTIFKRRKKGWGIILLFVAGILKLLMSDHEHFTLFDIFIIIQKITSITLTVFIFYPNVQIADDVLGDPS